MSDIDDNHTYNATPTLQSLRSYSSTPSQDYSTATNLLSNNNNQSDEQAIRTETEYQSNYQLTPHASQNITYHNNDDVAKSIVNGSSSDSDSNLSSDSETYIFSE
jgi:hypothetical protein